MEEAGVDEASAVAAVAGALAAEDTTSAAVASVAGLAAAVDSRADSSEGAADSWAVAVLEEAVSGVSTASVGVDLAGTDSHSASAIGRDTTTIPIGMDTDTGIIHTPTIPRTRTTRRTIHMITITIMTTNGRQGEFTAARHRQSGAKPTWATASGTTSASAPDPDGLPFITKERDTESASITESLTITPVSRDSPLQM
jgi:hypothetical protein